jgi:uncharacterized repeat protein (TIGR03803 family)
LIRDSAGNLYGTTEGSGFWGVVFKLDPAGVESVLHGVRDKAVGGVRTGPVISGGSVLYGTTTEGGKGGYGTVFKLDSSGLTTLYAFTGGLDGGIPFAGLLQDAARTVSAENVVGPGWHCRPAAGLVWSDDWKPMTTASRLIPSLPSGGQVVSGPFEWPPASALVLFAICCDRYASYRPGARIVPLADIGAEFLFQVISERAES